jgi:hypothetical protein
MIHDQDIDPSTDGPPGEEYAVGNTKRNLFNRRASK